MTKLTPMSDNNSKLVPDNWQLAGAIIFFIHIVVCWLLVSAG